LPQLFDESCHETVELTAADAAIGPSVLDEAVVEATILRKR